MAWDGRERCLRMYCICAYTDWASSQASPRASFS